jgi:hypothetical protein
MHTGIFYIYLLSFFSFSSERIELSADVSASGRSFDVSINTIINDSTSCIIPFNRVGNLMVVKAKVDTTEGNFILDTGAPHLVLNPTYFRDYPVTTSDGEQTNITGGTPSISTTSIGKLSFGTLSFNKLDADLVSLGNIENARGIKVLGLLGLDLFKQCEMIIDFEKSLIYLHRIGRKESSIYQHASLKDTSLYKTFPIEITDNRILVSTVLAGKKLKLVIDCAAESNILDSRLPNQVFENITITGKTKVTGTGNKKIEALLGTMSNMKMGDYDMGDMSVLVTNLEKTCFSYAGCVNGVLGFNFLSLHKVGFNFVKRKMYIWK